jgi:hypothetical protein
MMGIKSLGLSLTGGQQGGGGAAFSLQDNSTYWWDGEDAAAILTGQFGQSGEASNTDTVDVWLNRAALASGADGGTPDITVVDSVEGYFNVDSTDEALLSAGGTYTTEWFDVTPGDTVAIGPTSGTTSRCRVQSKTAGGTITYETSLSKANGEPAELLFTVPAGAAEMRVFFATIGDTARQLDVAVMPDAAFVQRDSAPVLSSTDGVVFTDDKLAMAFPGGVGPSSCDVFVVVEVPTVTEAILLTNEDASDFIMRGDDGETTNIEDADTPVLSNHWNKQQVGNSGDLAANWDSYGILEARDVDLSGWAGMVIGGFEGFSYEFSGNIRAVIVTPRLSDADRAAAYAEINDHYSLGITFEPIYDGMFDTGFIDVAATSWNGTTDTLTIEGKPNPSNDSTMSAFGDVRNYGVRLTGVNGLTPTFIMGNFGDVRTTAHSDDDWRMVWCYESAFNDIDGAQWSLFDNEAITDGGTTSAVLTCSMDDPFTEDSVIVQRMPKVSLAAFEAKIDAWVADGSTDYIAGGTYAVGTLPALTDSFGKPVPAYDARAFKIGTGSRNVLLFGNPHPEECLGHWSLFGAIDFLLSDDADAVALRSECTFQVYPNMHAQATYAGIPRSFVHDPPLEDGNRNWNTVDNQTKTLYDTYWTANVPSTVFATIEFHDGRAGSGRTDFPAFYYFGADDTSTEFVAMKGEVVALEGEWEDFGTLSSVGRISDSARAAASAANPNINLSAEILTLKIATPSALADYGASLMKGLLAGIDAL